MDVATLIDKLNTHSTEIYRAEITQMAENNKTVNWLLGLAGAGLIFSFDKFSDIIDGNRAIIVFQASIFLAIIILGFFYRKVSNSFMKTTTSIIRMFDFLKIEFEIIPDLIEKECETEKLDTIFNKYLNGEYFQEKDQTVFESICAQQAKYNTLISQFTIASIILMIFEFACFFIIVLI